jgi:hypothetical protein
MIIMMMSATYYMTPMMRSGCAMRRSPVAPVPLKTALVAVALFLVAVLILVGADVKTVNNCGEA